MNNQIQPYNTKLTKQNAYWMARFSKDVYLSDKKNKLLKTYNYENEKKFISIEEYDNKSSQAMLVENEDYLCMAFRGTDEMADWLDNLNAFTTKQLFGEFHKGFWNALNDIWDDLYCDYKRAYDTKHRPLFITGHSLGGAMATIAAAKFIHYDQPFTSVYTFGQPRCMTNATSRIFNSEAKSRFYRFHNNNDIVTRIPARIMGYSHVGNYHYITEEGEIHNEPGYWFKFCDYIDGIVESIKLDGLRLDGISDHNMHDYDKHIKNWNIK